MIKQVDQGHLMSKVFHRHKYICINKFLRHSLSGKVDFHDTRFTTVLYFGPMQCIALCKDHKAMKILR